MFSFILSKQIFVPIFIEIADEWMMWYFSSTYQVIPFLIFVKSSLLWVIVQTISDHFREWKCLLICFGLQSNTNAKFSISQLYSLKAVFKRNFKWFKIVTLTYFIHSVVRSKSKIYLNNEIVSLTHLPASLLCKFIRTFAKSFKVSSVRTCPASVNFLLNWYPYGRLSPHPRHKCSLGKSFGAVSWLHPQYSSSFPSMHALLTVCMIAADVDAWM